jgi:predicted nuclease with TOPRIM domain
MTDSNLFQILVAGLGGLGGIAGIVSLLVFIAGRIDKRRENSRAHLAKEISDAAEIKKIALEFEQKGAEAVEAALWKIVGEKNEEIKGLKEEIDQLEQNNSLARPLVTKIYTAVRTLRKSCDALERLINKQEAQEKLITAMDQLRANLESLEALLP